MADRSVIPAYYFQPPDGWAVGDRCGAGRRPHNMPMKPFYWKAHKRGKCYDEPPQGSKASASGGWYLCNLCLMSSCCESELLNR